eukprot:m51a1_g2752 hypothetical protein (174) ;mRNA; f:962946-963600
MRGVKSRTPSKAWKRLGHKKRRRSAIPGDKRVRAWWDPKKTVRQNYEAMGLVAQVNFTEAEPAALRPAEPTTGPVMSEDAASSAAPASEQQPKRKHCVISAARTKLPAPKPVKMTWTNKVYWSQLLAKHGQDYKAMARDIKLNPMQHAPDTCKKYCLQYLTSYANEDSSAPDK